MSEEKLRLLLIEDKKHDFLLSNRSLKRGPLACEITWVQRGNEAIHLLQTQRFDMITLDFQLPDMNGLEILQEIVDKKINVPVIFVTGSGDEQIAVQAMKKGAQDYLVKDPAGHYLELLPVVIEKTRREWQDRQARYLAEEAEKALRLEQERMRILSEFITNASHEFRTPLSVMKTALYLLGRNADLEKRQQFMERIENQISNLSSLVDDLVTMARLDRTSHFANNSVQINEILKQAASSLQTALEDQGHTLIFQLAPDLPEYRGEYTELILAFQKLLDNAIRFTPKQGNILMRSFAQLQDICIEIQDSGIGMNYETMEHAFERFYRADKAHSTRGFGLGLPIARAIIEKHRGRISLESELNEGTLLRISLPIY